MKQLSTIGVPTVSVCALAHRRVVSGAKVCKPQAAPRSRASMSETARAKKGAAQSDDCKSLELCLAAGVWRLRSKAAQVPCTFDWFWLRVAPLNEPINSNIALFPFPVPAAFYAAILMDFSCKNWIRIQRHKISFFIIYSQWVILFPTTLLKWNWE